MWSNTQFLADLVAFTEEILNKKLHVLCSSAFLLSTCKFTIIILHCLNPLKECANYLIIIMKLSPISSVPKIFTPSKFSSIWRLLHDLALSQKDVRINKKILFFVRQLQLRRHLITHSFPMHPFSNP